MYIPIKFRLLSGSMSSTATSGKKQVNDYLDREDIDPMKSSRTGLRMSYETRLARYADVSTNLALLSDQQLRERVKNAAILGTGIGGTSVLMQIEDTSTFVKIIPLTELEKRTENVMLLLLKLSGHKLPV